MSHPQQLRPCPFCGSDHIEPRSEDVAGSPPLVVHWCECFLCGARGSRTSVGRVLAAAWWDWRMPPRSKTPRVPGPPDPPRRRCARCKCPYTDHDRATGRCTAAHCECSRYMNPEVA
ncbi:MAG: hypothetical protein JWN86_706 [Planctomycetota bacterium]|nr:hypothetical protein [Planctomycetota bacterium]